ncbi:MAG TPA: hypothetical protein DD670_04400 [Planctomycetaceae bacterium]|nr:hypothetical protein [Planctomycetaceae bacterium]
MSHHTLLRWFLFGLVVGLLVLGAENGAWADPIYYTTQVGEDVVFDSIREDSATDPTPLYGPPTVSANSLVFFPVSFKAYASEMHPAVDLTDGTMSMTIRSLQGGPILGILVRESGDFTLGGLGTANTIAAVATPMFVTITQVDGQSITPISFSQSMTYSPKANGKFNLLDDEGVGETWEGLALLDVAGALAAAGIQGAATKVTLSLDNVLLATSEAASVAYIAKKQFGIEVLIPEPSTLTLLILACVGFLARGRRRFK